MITDEFDTDYDTDWLEYAHDLLQDLMLLAGDNKERKFKLGELTLHVTTYLLKSGSDTLTLH